MTVARLLKSHVNFLRLLNRCQRDTAQRTAGDAVELAARVDLLALQLQALTHEASALWSHPNSAVVAPTRAQLATFERAVKQLRELQVVATSSPSAALGHTSVSVPATAPITVSATTTTTTTTATTTTATSVVESVLELERAKERDARLELLGVRERRRTAARASAEKTLSAGELESQLAEEERLQAAYKRELARLAAVLKEAALQQSSVVKGGNAMIDTLNESVGENRERIVTENKRLKEHTDTWGSGILFYWIVLVFSMLAFVGTVIVIKVVPK